MTGSNGVSKNTLPVKLLVLRTSKAVFSEALPVFWKYHTLRIRLAVSPLAKLGYFLPDLRTIPKIENFDWFSQAPSPSEWVAPMTTLLTNLELIPRDIAPGDDLADHPIFSCILLDFPNLRLLRLDLTTIANCCSPWGGGQRLADPESKMTGMIVKLRARLELLELTMVYREDNSMVKFREAIGLGPPRDHEIVGTEYCGCTRSVWCLPRRRESSPDAKLDRHIDTTICLST